MDITQEENNKVKHRMKPLREYISNCKQILHEAKGDVNARGEKSLRDLQALKDQCIAMFDVQMKRVTNLMFSEQNVIDDQLEVIEEQSTLLQDLERRVETGTKDCSARDTVKLVDQIKAEIVGAVKSNTEYKYYVCENVLFKSDWTQTVPNIIERTAAMKPPLCDITSTFVVQGKGVTFSTPRFRNPRLDQTSSK